MKTFPLPKRPPVPPKVRPSWKMPSTLDADGISEEKLRNPSFLSPNEAFRVGLSGYRLLEDGNFEVLTPFPDFWKKFPNIHPKECGKFVASSSMVIPAPNNQFLDTQFALGRHASQLITEFDSTVGLGYSPDPKKPEIVIYLANESEMAAIPQDIEGIPLRKVVTGTFDATASAPTSHSGSSSMLVEIKNTIVPYRTDYVQKLNQGTLCGYLPIANQYYPLTAGHVNLPSPKLQFHPKVVYPYELPMIKTFASESTSPLIWKNSAGARFSSLRAIDLSGEMDAAVGFPVLDPPKEQILEGDFTVEEDWNPSKNYFALTGSVPTPLRLDSFTYTFYTLHQHPDRTGWVWWEMDTSPVFTSDKIAQEGESGSRVVDQDGNNVGMLVARAAKEKNLSAPMFHLVMPMSRIYNCMKKLLL